MDKMKLKGNLKPGDKIVAVLKVVDCNPIDEDAIPYCVDNFEAVCVEVTYPNLTPSERIWVYSEQIRSIIQSKEVETEYNP